MRLSNSMQTNTQVLPPTHSHKQPHFQEEHVHMFLDISQELYKNTVQVSMTWSLTNTNKYIQGIHTVFPVEQQS